LDRSEDDFGIGWMKIFFQLSGKIPVYSDILYINKIKVKKTTNLQFLKNKLNIKSGPGLVFELK